MNVAYSTKLIDGKFHPCVVVVSTTEDGPVTTEYVHPSKFTDEDKAASKARTAFSMLLKVTRMALENHAFLPPVGQRVTEGGDG